MLCDAIYVTVFKSLRFHLSALKTERFQSDAFSKISTVERVFDRQTKMLVWKGPKVVEIHEA